MSPSISSDFVVNPSFLPSRGIFVPTRMIFNPQLPSAVLVTWIQLHCLAWRGWSTPPLSIPELASLIAIHPARLERHLFQLQDISALVCRSTRDGKLIVSFPEEPATKTDGQAVAPDLQSSLVLDSPSQRSSEPSSYFPPRIMGYLSYDQDQDGYEITSNFESLDIGLEKAAKSY
jgi:hypothetical protein